MSEREYDGKDKEARVDPFINNGGDAGDLDQPAPKIEETPATQATDSVIPLDQYLIEEEGQEKQNG